ncbi:MAG: GTP 3',8-cyclase MoaA [Treponema sp.]|jgi:cyclic pyranopterin phosphate synthase|nr:GTP 3',8-cyclase MoaA [Treponema sp.]
MTDLFGRTIDYLRVSITDRCNLRCIYCMPPGGADWTPHKNILSFEEILRICGIMAGMGIRRVKVTGGEPLVRRGAVDFIASLKKIKGIQTVTLTTNGTLLEDELDRLADAELDGINISLDALNEKTFHRITRRDGLDKTLRAITDASAAGLRVKVNCVPLQGINEDELAGLAGLAKTNAVAVRFIELMPLGNAESFAPVPGKKIMELLEKEYGELIPCPGKFGNGPARYYSIRGFRGKIGFINAMTDGFCETCNRMRLTSRGLLKPCLSSEISLDLCGLLRGGPENIPGCSDREVEDAVRDLIAKKPRAHTFSAPYHQKKTAPADGMFRTGG